MRLLVISYNGFSDTNANGKTMKALLHSFRPEEMMQVYRSSDSPDFTACARYFRVTDSQLLKSFLGKKSRHYYEKKQEAEASPPAVPPRSAGRLHAFIKRNKYNYFLRGLREYLFAAGPWGKKELSARVKEFSPDAVIYMVGDNFSLDQLTLELVRQFRLPLVLYNPEAYRIVDLDTRRGLEKWYCRKIQKTYRQLSAASGLIYYNSGLLMESYQQLYGTGGRQLLAYHAAVCDCSPYRPVPGRMKIAYFGNLGVGRAQSLIEAARALASIDPELKIDVYGSSLPENEEALKNTPNILFHGFVGQDVLHQVREGADILLHTESFDPEIMPKLRYAFSTKIAQCLCSGRCFVSYAPEQTASSQYLLSNDCAVVISSRKDLAADLKRILSDGETRALYAGRGLEIGERNHDLETTSRAVAAQIRKLASEN